MSLKAFRISSLSRLFCNFTMICLFMDIFLIYCAGLSAVPFSLEFLLFRLRILFISSCWLKPHFRFPLAFPEIWIVLFKYHDRIFLSLSLLIFFVVLFWLIILVFIFHIYYLFLNLSYFFNLVTFLSKISSRNVCLFCGYNIFFQ